MVRLGGKMSLQFDGAVTPIVLASAIAFVIHHEKYGPHMRNFVRDNTVGACVWVFALSLAVLVILCMLKMIWGEIAAVVHLYKRYTAERRKGVTRKNAFHGVALALLATDTSPMEPLLADRPRVRCKDRVTRHEAGCSGDEAGVAPRDVPDDDELCITAFATLKIDAEQVVIAFDARHQRLQEDSVAIAAGHRERERGEILAVDKSVRKELTVAFAQTQLSECDSGGVDVGSQRFRQKLFGVRVMLLVFDLSFMVTNCYFLMATEHTDDIVQLVFQYLSMLRNEGPQKWIFQELQELWRVAFRFKGKDTPQSYVRDLSGMLHYLPFQDVLAGPYIIDEYRPDLIKDLLGYLRPENVRVAVVAKHFTGQTDSVEKWYGTLYKLDRIPEAVMQVWQEPGVNKNLKLPPRNEFIPSNFDQCPREPEGEQLPVMIKNTEGTRVWFVQDHTYNLPKAVLHFQFKSPVAYQDPHHTNMTHMFVRLFTDALNEYTYAAMQAGLSYSLDNTIYGIVLSIRGYNDKQHVLLAKIMDKMTNFVVDQQRFDILREAYVRGLKNFTAEPPHQHAVYYTYMLLAQKVWSHNEMLEATEGEWLSHC
ncbi:hypothetical protein V5799_029833 [Amblyomma americanum]|uniref:Peptidase M16 middle/third domain-containing protein n=1 Tax=Amblyomma americanum TaxID=6943 RepID=A0AAQ4EQ33_AMBAM